MANHTNPIAELQDDLQTYKFLLFDPEPYVGDLGKLYSFEESAHFPKVAPLSNLQEMLRWIIGDESEGVELMITHIPFGTYIIFHYVWGKLVEVYLNGILRFSKNDKEILENLEKIAFYTTVYFRNSKFTGTITGFLTVNEASQVAATTMSYDDTSSIDERISLMIFQNTLSGIQFFMYPLVDDTKGFNVQVNGKVGSIARVLGNTTVSVRPATPPTPPSEEVRGVIDRISKYCLFCKNPRFKPYTIIGCYIQCVRRDHPTELAMLPQYASCVVLI
jgi:hypothetical protein